MRSRTSRYTLEMQVLPSLRVNAFTRASSQNLNEYILGLEVSCYFFSNTYTYIYIDFIVRRKVYKPVLIWLLHNYH
jgi:hypothetical protein